jgi:DNA-binding NtrC family response regulator
MVATNADRSAVEPQRALVIDDAADVQRIIEMALQQIDITVESFPAAKEAFASIDRCHPAIIFLDVALLRSDAIDVLNGLGQRRYGGVVQLMSGGRPSLLQAVARIGVRQGLKLSTPLNKPFAPEAIVRAVERLRSGEAAGPADQGRPSAARAR